MSQKWVRRADLLAADMDGETVMMDVCTGQYYNLGAIGGRIWALLDKPKDMAALVDALTEEYDVSREQCEAEVRPFIEALLEKGLVLGMQS